MNNAAITSLINSLSKLTHLNDKQKVSNSIAKEFKLTKSRSVYHNADFALRFSSSESKNFGNTVLSLSTLLKYDHLPFIVVLILPNKIECLLANSTLLKKISHSSQELTKDNIRGSFNGSDILRELSGVANEAKNLTRLFNIHISVDASENILRLVEATNNIVPTGSPFIPDSNQLKAIMNSPTRALNFLESSKYEELNEELNQKVSMYEKEILLAAQIENVNVRGRVIEYLIVGEDQLILKEIISALHGKRKGLPAFKTENDLGDYLCERGEFFVATDVKSKLANLSSNPKAYNLDKMLEFLSKDNSVFLFFFVEIDPKNVIKTILISIFEKELLNATVVLNHWAGRNSRGVTQFDGTVIHELILNESSKLEITLAEQFLSNVIQLVDEE
jgi:hypothetical protein